MREDQPIRWRTIVTGALLGMAAIVAAGMTGCPVYNVWSAQKSGEAELAQATANRRIKIQEAEAQKESAQHLADAEVIRATGVAKANQIIGNSLKGNDAYLRYLWIQSLADNGRDKEVIYVPTEANLPVLEAGRLSQGKGAPAK